MCSLLLQTALNVELWNSWCRMGIQASRTAFAEGFDAKYLGYGCYVLRRVSRLQDS